MLWFYSRDDEAIRLVTRYDNRTAEYVLIVQGPDGRHREEHFTMREHFTERLVELETRLAAERWTSAGPPAILADGWPNKRLV